MPGQEDFLRSFFQQQASPPPGFIVDDEGNVFEEYIVPEETVTGRSIFNPGAITETYSRVFREPRSVKQDLVAEGIGRFRNTPNSNDPNVGAGIVENIFREAKSQGLNPYADWRSGTTIRDIEYARDFINDAKQEFSDFGKRKLGPLNKLKDIRSSVSNFVEGLRLPGFIADPLALRSPVVQGTDLVQAGSLVNPQAVKFIRDFSPSKARSGTNFESPFGTTVQVANRPGSPYYDIAFQGPFGYRQSRSIKKEIKEDLDRAALFESRGDLETAGALRDMVMNKQEMLNEPLRSPSLRYTLAEALQSVPVGATVTASPIGAEKGSRARIYSRMTNDALATFKGLTPNLNQLPTDEEFRAAAQGEGYQSADLAQINRNRGLIRTERLSPTTWRNVNKEERTFDPATLKDEMIRATYNLPASTDVSQLRDNPLGLFERTNRIDFTRPVITPESPIYKFRKGLKGGIGIGAADFIPTPEAIRDLYSGQPLSALQRTGQNIVQGLPLAAAIGGAVAAAPALAPVAGAAGTGLALNALGAAGNEIVRQQTGEGIIPKVRQFLGTMERTGTASRPQPARPAVTPRLVRTAPVNPIVQQIQNRLGLAGARFNPARGEFGLSELLFGR